MKRITLNDHIIIQEGLDNGLIILDIAKTIDKELSSVIKEIRTNCSAELKRIRNMQK